MLFLAVLAVIPSCSKSDEKPSALIIYKLRVNKFPPLKSTGAEWDSQSYYDGEPDLQLRLSADSAYLYNRAPDAFEDATAGYYSYDFLLANAITITAEDDYSYKLSLYDLDTYNSELMGEVAFDPFEEAAGFQESFSVKNGDVAFQVFVYYIF